MDQNGGCGCNAVERVVAMQLSGCDGLLNKGCDTVKTGVAVPSKWGL